MRRQGALDLGPVDVLAASVHHVLQSVTYEEKIAVLVADAGIAGAGTKLLTIAVAVASRRSGAAEHPRRANQDFTRHTGGSSPPFGSTTELHPRCPLDRRIQQVRIVQPVLLGRERDNESLSGSVELHEIATEHLQRLLQGAVDRGACI